MCGIFCILCTKGSVDCDNCKYLRKTYLRDGSFWKNRGPDGVSEFVNHPLSFAGCVLHLRGSNLVRQPLVDKERVLLWNGELFKWSSDESKMLDVTMNDSKLLFDRLATCESKEAVLSIFELIQGPFATIYYDSRINLLVYGRDMFGRRSLLESKTLDGHWILSSVAVADSDNPSQQWFEVSAVGLFCMTLDTLSSTTCSELSAKLYPWALQNVETINSEDYKSECVNINIQSVSLHSSVDLDISSRQTIPLQSVCNVSAHSQDNLVSFTQLFTNLELQAIKLNEVLKLSVETRIYNIPSACKACFSVQNNQCCHSKLAVLFSGGLDSAVITAIAASLLSDDTIIDLYNVAFSNPPTANASNCNIHNNQFDFMVPDRITGLQTLTELRQLYPKVVFNFLEINVTSKELAAFRKQRIQALCYPKTTVLDDSLGCALWFASSGRGVLNKSHNPHIVGAEQMEYVSNAKVVLCGMGADEQLCGYSRHRVVHKEHGYAGVDKEITMEIKRISHRNMGRDDRIISDHGREARYPFLDERLVNYLYSLEPYLKANLEFDRGVGEKAVLRAVAYRMGLHKAALLPKRAMQFGSRIAKLENRKEKASDTCSRLQQND